MIILVSTYLSFVQKARDTPSQEELIRRFQENHPEPVEYVSIRTKEKVPTDDFLWSIKRSGDIIIHDIETEKPLRWQDYLIINQSQRYLNDIFQSRSSEKMEAKFKQLESTMSASLILNPQENQEKTVMALKRFNIRTGESEMLVQELDGGWAPEATGSLTIIHDDLYYSPPERFIWTYQYYLPLSASPLSEFKKLSKNFVKVTEQRGLFLTSHGCYEFCGRNIYIPSGIFNPKTKQIIEIFDEDLPMIRADAADDYELFSMEYDSRLPRTEYIGLNRNHQLLFAQIGQDKSIKSVDTFSIVPYGQKGTLIDANSMPPNITKAYLDSTGESLYLIGSTLYQFQMNLSEIYSLPQVTANQVYSSQLTVSEVEGALCIDTNPYDPNPQIYRLALNLSTREALNFDTVCNKNHGQSYASPEEYEQNQMEKTFSDLNLPPEYTLEKTVRYEYDYDQMPKGSQLPEGWEFVRRQ